MTARKFMFVFPALLLAALMTFGQLRDESVLARSVDPIKLVQLYPNPATETINVKFDAPIAKKVKVSLHNVIGNVMDVETEVLDEHEIRIRVKELATGYYLISVKDEQANIGSTFKFLKR
jgi:hypothetical protein